MGDCIKIVRHSAININTPLSCMWLTLHIRACINGMDWQDNKRRYIIDNNPLSTKLD